MIDAINELHNAMSSGKGKLALEGILNGLAGYATSHFASEEEEIVRHGYPDYEAQGRVPLSHEVSDFLSNWLNKHIAGTDKQYSSFMNGVGVN